MNYSINADIVSGSIDPDKLIAELVAANCVSDVPVIIIIGDSLSIQATITNETVFDATVRAHAAVSLSDLKANKILEIDARTYEIIGEGFTFDSHQFSLSPQSQTAWLGLISLQSLFTWPMEITDNANGAYSLSQANVTAFVGTGIGVMNAAISSGRALKIQCNAATTQGELDAVVDTR
jgi:hypothetical protein